VPAADVHDHKWPTVRSTGRAGARCGGCHSVRRSNALPNGPGKTGFRARHRARRPVDARGCRSPAGAPTHAATLVCPADEGLDRIISRQSEVGDHAIASGRHRRSCRGMRPSINLASRPPPGGCRLDDPGPPPRAPCSTIPCRTHTQCVGRSQDRCRCQREKLEPS